MQPECFTTFGNIGFKKQIITLLKSLAIFHPNSNIIIFVDTDLHTELEKFLKEKDLGLNIEMVIKLDKYSKKNRAIMQKEGIFKEFTIIKADLVEYALTKFSNVCFLDGDILLVNPITIPENYKEFEIGLSPHFILPRCVRKVGFYNVGFFFINGGNEFVKFWKQATVKSRYYEQASLENCAKRFKTFCFGDNFNVAWWKVELGLLGKEQTYKLFSSDSENIYYKKNPIIFIHSHFDGDCRFNKTMKQLLLSCEKKKFLLEYI
jgi:hypothetical protein